jgi:predicted nucleotidyltransferase
MDNLGLSEKNLKLISETISSFSFVERAVVFGSRAKGMHKKYSDVDICLFGEMEALDAQRVESALDDLNVIYEFDVVSYGEIMDDALKEHIDRVGVEFYKPKSARRIEQ